MLLAYRIANHALQRFWQIASVAFMMNGGDHFIRALAAHATRGFASIRGRR